MTLKRLEIFIITVIIALIGVVYALTKSPVKAPTLANPDQQNQNQGIAVGEPNPSAPVEYAGQDGKNALDLLKQSHRVEVKSYSFGDMVMSIDSIAPDAKHFWAMYVNGQLSQVGASQYISKSTDRISWKLEEIKQ
ncbi:MAG: DUF4430 domain-containing protein [Candidatus Doudnabacteria bacterium]|nr:DUF4430 domain-containing protein [Candidatus Doudnabacteria bacterium]